VARRFIANSLIAAAAMLAIAGAINF